MRGLILTTLLVATPALALNEGLQCVPYARALSGVQIRGDAHTWWGQAAGHYERGNRPRVGAVMSFRPFGKMRLGHVAAVRRIIDDRTIIISHANWSTINGHRGHVEQNVRAIDVSENNDWSRVRVWYTPNEAMGGTAWPVNGFIYPSKRLSDKEANKAVVALLGAKAPKMMPAGGSDMLDKEKPVKFAKADIKKADKANTKVDVTFLKFDKNSKDNKADKANGKDKPVQVKLAQAKPAAKAETGRFTLSSKFLAKIDKKAAKQNNTRLASRSGK